jgi:hypothetical protein
VNNYNITYQKLHFDVLHSHDLCHDHDDDDDDDDGDDDIEVLPLLL